MRKTNTTTADVDLPQSEPAAQPAPRKIRQRRMARQPSGDPQPKKPAPSPRGPSKISEVIALLKREGGATLAELIEATGWLPHTTRAALTGLRKKGHAIDKTAREGTTVYSIAEAA